MPDPILFERALTVTIQQIGNNVFFPDEGPSTHEVPSLLSTCNPVDACPSDVQ